MEYPRFSDATPYDVFKTLVEKGEENIPGGADLWGLPIGELLR